MHELSATYEIDGRFINLPTVVNGEHLEDDDVIAAFRAGRIDPLVDPLGAAVYGNLQDAIAGARMRSQDMPIETLLGGIGPQQTVAGPTATRPDTGFWQAMWAGIEKESIFGALIRFGERERARGNVFNPDRHMASFGGGLDEFTPADPNYNPLADPLVAGRPELYLEVLGSESPSETRMIVRQYEDLREIDALIGQDPVGLFGVMGGGLLNPSSTVPLIGVAKQASRLKRFAYGTAAGAIAVAPEEALQSEYSPGRSTAESVWVIGGAAVTIGALNALFGRRVPSRPGVLGEGETATGGSSGRLGRVSPDQYRDIDWSTLRETRTYEGSTVGAMAYGNIRRSYRDELEAEAAVETGTGLERLGWNPVFRLLGSASPLARSFVSDLVDTALIKAKNLRGEATGASVETTFRTTWLRPLVDSIIETDQAYLRYVARKRGQPIHTDAAPRGMLRTQFATLAADIRARLSRDEIVPSRVFRMEVADALRNTEHHIPEVMQAAQAWRRNILVPLQEGAHEMDLFTRRMRKMLQKLEVRQKQLQNMANSRRATAGERATAARDLQQVAEEIAEISEKIERITREGPTINTARGYFPRIWRHDKVMKDRDVLRGILSSWLRRRNREMTLQEANHEAENLIDHILQERTFLSIDRSRVIEERAEASAARERTIDIPDAEIREFLENDVETVLRHHTRTVGMDIEISRRFGDIDLRAQLDAVSEEFDELINAAQGAERARLQRDKKAALRDLEALRDRLRGTYGVPNDPYRPISRALRIMKSFNVITMMGGATVAAIPDIARALFTDGLERGFGAAYRMLWSNQAKTFRAMSRDELRAAGEGLDIVLGIRALQMADVGDVFGRRFAAERGLTAATGAYFLANGLHMWNTMMKEWAGAVTGIRINAHAIAWRNGTLDRAGQAKLAAAGIDRNMAWRIADETRKYGTAIDKKTGEWIEDTSRIRNPDRYDWLPNTDEWEDVAAAWAYRKALNQDVNRVIVTPGAGDRALWTSNEFGSTIAQFKSFAQGATQRVLVRGLQESDANFYMGVIMLVALGGVVNETKRMLWGDRREQSAGGRLVDAIDRSGVLGWFMDVNNSIERLSDYKIGLRPVVEGSQPYSASTRTVLGALAGPTGSQLDNMRKLAGDLGRGRFNQYTRDRLERLTPGANLFYLQALARMYELGGTDVNGNGP